MEFFDCRYYKYNRILLSLIGQWPYEDWKTNLPRTLLISLVLASGFLSLTFKFLTLNYNMDSFVELIQIVIYMMVCIINYCIHCFNHENMKTLLEHIKCDWSLLETAEERGIIQKYAEIGRLYSVLLITSFSIASTCFILAASGAHILDLIAPLNESRVQEHPFPAEYFVDPRTYYVPILIHMLLNVTIALTVTLTSFVTNATYVQHACGMYSLVGYQLEFAFGVGGQENCFANEAIHSHGRVARSAVFHERTICFSKTLSACYMPPYLMQILLVVLLLSINIYRIMYIYTISGSTGELLMCVLGTYGLLLCLSFVCYTGQQLLDHSSNVCYKAYSSQWFLGPSETQKLLLIIMMRSAKSCGIGITKTITASLTLLAATLQTSMSYFMALWSLQ